MSEKLLPCPFCGGDAEMDTQQAYRALSGGRIGTRIAIYCTKCDADMGRCREDVPDLRAEEIIEIWNRRPSDVLEALQEAYTHISQPLRMTQDRAEYSTRNYNQLTAKLRAAIARAAGASQ